MSLRPIRRNPELRPSPHGKNLAGMDLSGQDLSHMDLSGADLSSARLTAADLTAANLRGARLEGARLTFANLTAANLTNANLTGANLFGAHLINAGLTFANLSGANLEGANLNRADLRGAKLIDADLTGANLTEANLAKADLHRAKLIDASLRHAKLMRADFTGADFTGADLCRANFTNANFSGADFSGANLEDAYTFLAGANFSGANLNGANLKNVYLADNDFTGVDLTQALNVERIGLLREHYEIRTPTSPAFKHWFGESVVVGDDRKPVVVYHGTDRGGFTKFDPAKRDPHHNAFYFADNVAVAETYTTRERPPRRPDPAAEPGEDDGIYRLYIRLVNPMIIEGAGREWRELHDPRAPKLRKTYEFAKWAKAHGHDGVIFRDIVDDGDKGPERAPAATVYAVFDPKAIKSATANNGNYDPDDADIRHNPAIKPSSVATIIFDERGRALILRRGPTAPWMPGKWSLPGGTVDPGEGLQQAALREAVEETTLVVERVRPLAVIAHEPEGWSAAFFVSKPGEWRGKVELDYENDAFAWISERDISRYSFIPTVVEALHTAFRRRARAPR